MFQVLQTDFVKDFCAVEAANPTSGPIYAAPQRHCLPSLIVSDSSTAGVVRVNGVELVGFGSCDRGSACPPVGSTIVSIS